MPQGIPKQKEHPHGCLLQVLPPAKTRAARRDSSQKLLTRNTCTILCVLTLLLLQFLLVFSSVSMRNQIILLEYMKIQIIFKILWKKTTEFGIIILRLFETGSYAPVEKDHGSRKGIGLFNKNVQ